MSLIHENKIDGNLEKPRHYQSGILFMIIKPLVGLKLYRRQSY